MRMLLCIAAALLTAACTSSHNSLPTGDIFPAHSALWVDTDIVVNPFIPADPDDAIAFELLRKSGIHISGVSTSGGNGDEASVWATAQERITWAPLHRGGDGSCSSPAVQALAHALTTEDPLTILALGPLTNIASVIRCHPEVVPAIKEIVFVAGRRPDEEFWLGDGGVSFRGLKDLNFETDPDATKTVMRANVSLRLVPFASGEQVRFSYGEIAAHADAELSDAIRSWVWTLAFVGGRGTLPAFDPVAASVLLWPHLFICEPAEVRIETNQLIAELAQGDAGDAFWCDPDDAALVKAHILALLK